MPLPNSPAHKMQLSPQHLQFFLRCVLLCHPPSHLLQGVLHPLQSHLHAIFTVSNMMPRNTILVAGAHALATDSVNPSFFNNSSRNSKVHCALRTPKVIKIIQDLHTTLLANIYQDVNRPLTSSSSGP